MPNNRLKKIIPQPFRLSDTNELLFSELEESLQQQSERDYITLLPSHGVLAVTGPEAGKFLQGQLTCDLDAVNEQQSCLGAHCTPQGRVIASFRTCRIDAQDYQFIMPREVIPSLHDALARYIVFSKAKLTDCSDDYVVIGLSGARADNLLRQLFDELPSSIGAQVVKDGALGVRVPGQTPRYELCLTVEQAAALWRRAVPYCQPADSAAWALQNIRAGIASIGTHTTEMFIPQMLNYDKIGAISFNKGCYTGQEIIARAHYRGAVKRRLHRFTCQTHVLPEVNQQVFVGSKQVGTLLNWVQPEAGVLEGLIVLQEGIRESIKLSLNSRTTLTATPCHD